MRVEISPKWTKDYLLEWADRADYVGHADVAELLTDIASQFPDPEPTENGSIVRIKDTDLRYVLVGHVWRDIETGVPYAMGGEGLMENFVVERGGVE